jgi:hypothetical protein
MLLHAHSGIARKIPGGVWAGATRLPACRAGSAALVAPAHTPRRAFWEISGVDLEPISARYECNPRGITRGSVRRLHMTQL